jgi:hypothetical protein
MAIPGDLKAEDTEATGKELKAHSVYRKSMPVNDRLTVEATGKELKERVQGALARVRTRVDVFRRSNWERIESGDGGGGSGALVVSEATGKELKGKCLYS